MLLESFLGRFGEAVALAIIGSFVAAFVLQFAVKFVCKFKPSYWMAYEASFIVIIVCHGIVDFLLALVVIISGFTVVPMLKVLSVLIGFFVTSGLVGRIIKHPETGQIGFRKGILITLVGVLMQATFLGLIVFIIVLVNS